MELDSWISSDLVNVIPRFLQLVFWDLSRSSGKIRLALSYLGCSLVQEAKYLIWNSMSGLLHTERRPLLTCQRAIATMLMSKTWPWVQIWLAIKPYKQYKQQYETQIETAEKNFGSAIAECKAVTVVYDRLIAEKTELTNVLESWDSAVQDIIDKTARMENVRNYLQKQVTETEQRVKSEENLIEGINKAGEKVTADSNKLMDEIKSLENECDMAEEDNSTKDNKIKTLCSENVTSGVNWQKLNCSRHGNSRNHCRHACGTI